VASIKIVSPFGWLADILQRSALSSSFLVALVRRVVILEVRIGVLSRYLDGLLSFVYCGVAVACHFFAWYCVLITGGGA